MQLQRDFGRRRPFLVVPGSRPTPAAATPTPRITAPRGPEKGAVRAQIQPGRGRILAFQLEATWARSRISVGVLGLSVLSALAPP